MNFGIGNYADTGGPRCEWNQPDPVSFFHQMIRAQPSSGDFAGQGFPQGKLGMLLSTIYEIKLNGLEQLLVPLKNQS